MQSPVAPVLRWLTLLGALTMAGGLVFELLVTRPVLFGLRSTPAMAEAGRRLSVRSLGLTWLALAVFLGASAGQLLLLSVITNEVSSWSDLPKPLWNTISATGMG